MEEDCNCIQDMQEKMIEHISKNPKAPKGFKVIGSEWENCSVYPKLRLYVNYIINSTFSKVNGAPSKPKNSHVSIYFTYCPFCGKEYKK